MYYFIMFILIIIIIEMKLYQDRLKQELNRSYSDIRDLKSRLDYFYNKEENKEESEFSGLM